MTIVLNTVRRGIAAKFALFAIGVTIAFCIMIVGSVTGVADNPARILGPAVGGPATGAGKMTEVIPYMVAQFAGGDRRRATRSAAFR